MTYESSLAVARIIQRCPQQHADVLSCRQEVTWPDGSRIGLHPVLQHGARATYLRAVHHAGHWLLFDLRHTAPKVAADLPTAPLRDVPGTVLYGLRAAYRRGADFMALVQQHALATWPGEPRPCDPRPSRSGALHLDLQAAA